MKKILILFLLFVNANSLVSNKQLKYLSHLDLAMKIADRCRFLDFYNIKRNFLFYKYIKIKINTSGSYNVKTNLYELIAICNEITKKD